MPLMLGKRSEPAVDPPAPVVLAPPRQPLRGSLYAQLYVSDTGKLSVRASEKLWLDVRCVRECSP